MDAFSGKPIDPASRLGVWDALQTTDPKYTKHFDKGSFKGTSINATYVAKRLTEQFGPCGMGWRFVLDEERIVPGPATTTTRILKSAKAGEDGAATEDVTEVATVQEQLHVVRGHIEYRGPDGVTYSTGPQFGQTKLVTVTNAGKVLFDEEAPKKSVTDCLTKCAVLLGVAADIHMGMYDDNKYVNDLNQRFAPKLDAVRLNTLLTEMKQAGLKEPTFCKTYNIRKVEDLHPDHYDGAIAKIRQFAEKRAAEKVADPKEQP